MSVCPSGTICSRVVQSSQSSSFQVREQSESTQCTKKAIREHSESNQRAIREQSRALKSESYSRSLKYCVLFINKTSPDEFCLAGNLSDGLAHGLGTHYYENGNILFRGETVSCPGQSEGLSLSKHKSENKSFQETGIMESLNAGNCSHQGNN